MNCVTYSVLYEDLTCLISTRLNSPGKTWIVGINGPGKSWKTHIRSPGKSWKTTFSVLYAPRDSKYESCFQCFDVVCCVFSILNCISITCSLQWFTRTPLPGTDNSGTMAIKVKQS